MMAIGACFEGEQGRYTIAEVLHVSPQLITARAHDADGRPVVLKQLRLGRLQSWKVLELFERETRILKQLDHPQLPRYLDTFQIESDADTCLYLVCSWAEGESLLDKLAADWLPTADEVWEIARQSLEILSYLHAFNPAIIHRDLKPGNLILSAEGVVRLVDLGAVQGVLNPDGGSTVVGTFGYMPPEQFSDQSVPATDLYALGASLIHLLCGRYPSDLPRRGMKLDYRASLLVSCRPFYLDWLDKLIAPEVENRFQTAESALAALDEKLAGQPQVGRSGRISTLARGTGYKVVIAPAGLKAGLLTPRNALGAIPLLLGVTGLTHYLVSVAPVSWASGNLAATLVAFFTLNFFSLLMAGFGLGLIAQNVKRALTETVIQLQPDRYLIQHQGWRLRKRIEGSSSELQHLQHGFSPLSLNPACKIVERSDLEHVAAFHLNSSQRRELAGHLARYLHGLDSQQAETLLRESLDPPLRARSLGTDWLRLMQVRDGLMLWLQTHQLKGSRWLLDRLPAGWNRRLTRLFCLERVQSTWSPAGLQIRLGARWPGPELLPQTLIAGYWLYGVPSYYFDSRGYQLATNGWEWMLFNDHGFQAGVLVYLLVGGLFVSRVLERLLYSQVRTTLTLDDESYQIHHRFFGFNKRFHGDIANLRDLALTENRGYRRRHDLVLREANGRPQVAAYWLSRQDLRSLIAPLAQALPAENPRVFPTLAAFSLDWRHRFARWDRIAFGRPQRLEVEFQDERTLTRIPPHQLAGRLLRGFLLGLALIGAALPLGLMTQVALLGWLTALLGVALMLGTHICAQIQSTLILTPAALQVYHQLGRWTFSRELSLANLEVSPSKSGKRLKLRSGKAKIAAGYYLQRQDVAELRHQLGRYESAVGPATLPETLAGAGSAKAFRRFWQRFWMRLRGGRLPAVQAAENEAAADSELLELTQATGLQGEF